MEVARVVTVAERAAREADRIVAAVHGSRAPVPFSQLMDTVPDMEAGLAEAIRPLLYAADTLEYVASTDSFVARRASPAFSDDDLVRQIAERPGGVPLIEWVTATCSVNELLRRLQPLERSNRVAVVRTSVLRVVALHGAARVPEASADLRAMFDTATVPAKKKPVH